MTHNQYGFIFLLFAICTVGWAVSAHFAVTSALLFWLTVSLVWVAGVYFLHRPEMLMGKRQDGKVFLPFCFVSFPFLTIYWVAWLIRNVLLNREPVNVITGTNISISCWPGFHVPLDCYDLVIDVTSEMPSYKPSKAKYICLPNLDGVSLDRYKLPIEINRDLLILVHCAQGCGRSAQLACLILVKLGYVASTAEALQILKQSRSCVKLSQYQVAQLENFVQNNM